MQATETLRVTIYGLAFPDQPIKAIKALREIFSACRYGQSLGLREAKHAVDALKAGGSTVTIDLHDVQDHTRALVRSYVKLVFITEPQSSRVALSI